MSTAVAHGYELGPDWDEAFDRSGTPRGGYGAVLGAIEDAGPSQVAAALNAHVERAGLTFTSPDEPLPTCPVPRLVAHDEWASLTAALAQRLRALNAFIADVYGERRIIAAGVIPADAVTSAEYYEPAMSGVEPVVPHAVVAGFDVVRGSDGRLRVLEDNLRTPSGVAYAVELRRLMQRVLPGLARMLSPLALGDSFEPLGRVLREAQAAQGSGAVAVLSDGPSNSAWYEHCAIARRLGIPVVVPERLRLEGGRLHAAGANGSLKELGVIYRRTDEDRLRAPDGSATWLGEMLTEPLRRGTLTVVNAPGAGVADDKLLHAYVEEMVRFYLGEEPLIESVRTYDLTRPHALTRALGRLPNMVVKPRAGQGGAGVVICRDAGRRERERIAAALRAEPAGYVAQEMVMLSRHPTVRPGAIEPRRVDLRVFAVAGRSGVDVLPAALTRVAADPASLIVNSSQGGGAKDTWIVADASA